MRYFSYAAGIAVCLCCLAVQIAVASSQELMSKIVPLQQPVSRQAAEVCRSTPILRATDGSEDLSHVQFVAGPRFPRENLDVVGDLYEAGRTLYDQQHNSTAGRMIAVDDSGYVHVAWMKAIAADFAQRDIYYNVWNPNTLDWQAGIPDGGVQANIMRAGYTSLATTPGGFAFPSFHGLHPGFGNTFLSQSAIDFLPRAGAYTPFAINPLFDSTVVRQTIWPKVAIGQSGNLHVVSTENLPAQRPFFYSRGIPVYDQGFGTEIQWQHVDSIDGQPVQLQLIENASTVCPNIAASRVSNRVVIVWSSPLGDPSEGGLYQDNNDLYISISEDDGLNWGESINVTDFCGPDRDCQNGNWQTCNNDTMRVWADNSILIDDADNIHVAFTTVSYHYWTSDGQPSPSSGFPYSAIWYWNSATNEFSPVATQFSETPVGVVGGWHRTVCKPSLAYDDVTEDLYCSYWKAMPDQWSEAGFAMGDIYVSKSVDSGLSWSEGRNVTDTDGGQGTPAPGSLSERDATVAERITSRDGTRYLHMFYELDHDAGAIVMPEGAATENELYYQAIPVDSIPDSPTVPWQPLHVASGLGACCYTNTLNEIVCEQKLICECDALGGYFHGAGTPDCEPINDHCPGTTIECLPFTASGNNCCAALDWNDCGISARDVFFNYTPQYTTTARLSLCDSPESWDSYISIYSAAVNGECTDGIWSGCLDNGCGDPLHVNQLFTFNANTTYYLVLSGFYPEDCGSFVFNMTSETNFDLHYPEPDTLSYDNDSSAIYDPLSNLWYQLRLTAPSDFALHTAYVYAIDGTDGCPQSCSLYVYDAPPTAGGEVTTGSMIVNEDFDWVDAQFVNTVTIAAGSDFWLQFGPVPGGLQGDGNWNPVFDNAATDNRSGYSTGGQFGNYLLTPGDLLVRVGGVMSLGNPDSLVIHVADNGEDIELSWSPAPGAGGYTIYRSLTEDIQPLPEFEIATTVEPSFVDTGVLTGPDDQYYYIVTAVENTWWRERVECGNDSKTPHTNNHAAFAPMQVKTR